jgi:hypothetical protein
MCGRSGGYPTLILLFLSNCGKPNRIFVHFPDGKQKKRRSAFSYSFPFQQ